MKTIKELETEYSELKPFGKGHLKGLKDVIKLINEMQLDKPVDGWEWRILEELKSKIKGK